MRLTLRMTLTVTLLMAVVLVSLSVLSIDREVALIEADIERDAALVALSLAHAGAGEAALQVVDRFLTERTPGMLHVKLRDSVDALAADADVSARALLARGEVLVQHRQHDGATWVHAAALQSSGPGVVEVVESLEPRNAFVRRALATNALAVVLTTVFGGLVTLVFGRRLVGDRVQALVSHARHLGEGDFGHLAAVGGSDELTELGAALNRLASDLERAHDRLEAEGVARLEAQQALEHTDRLRMVGQLAAGLAHEIGTPLAIIAGRAQLLGRRAAADSREQREATTIREQAQHISDLVQRLLDYSRGGAPRPQRHDLMTLAKDAVELLAPLARSRQVTLSLDAASASTVAMVDPRSVQQVIINLVMNAVQACAAEGHVSVRLDGDTGDGWVRLVVTDDGPGVPEAVRAQIFEPFFTTKSPGDGTGLGLSIVERIVTAHGGEVTLASVPGETAFTVALRAPDAAQPPPPAGRPPAEEPADA